MFKGGVVFASGREMKNFSTVFRNFGKIWSGNNIFNARGCQQLLENNEQLAFKIINNGISIFVHL